MRPALAIMLLLVLSPATLAQEAPDTDTVQWAVALAERFRQMHNPVVVTHALAALATTVCPHDPVAASGLYRDALTRLNSLPDDVFEEGGPVLPVASLSGLWRFVRSGAERCDPALAGVRDSSRLEAELAAERREANDKLARALSFARTRPDRASQLAAAAMEAGDPTTLDVAALAKFLSKLRDRAPDLTDELFPKAVGFATAENVPSPSLLLELGTFLFVPVNKREQPDKEHEKTELPLGDAVFPDLTAIRHSTNPDHLEAWVEAAASMLTTASASRFRADLAFALAYQALPKARERVPDAAERLETAFAGLEADAGSAVGVIQSSLAATGMPDIEGGESGLRRYRMVGRVLDAITANRFEEARQVLLLVDDLNVRGQVRALIDFGEAARSIERRDLERAFLLANRQRPAVKRTLLYAGIVAAGGRDPTLSELSLARKDVGLLAAEHRVALQSALAAVTLPQDAERGLALLDAAVSSRNDAVASPRRGRFDPGIIRRPVNLTVDRPTDANLIVFGRRGLYEVIDTGYARHNFPLRVRGVSAFTFPDALSDATAISARRLQAILLRLNDETDQAVALNALVQSRKIR